MCVTRRGAFALLLKETPELFPEVKGPTACFREESGELGLLLMFYYGEFYKYTEVD